MGGIRKCDFRTTGLFSRISFQIQIVFALSFWISHVLSDVPVSNFPTPLAQTNVPAPAPAPLIDTSPPAQYINPPETALAPPPAENITANPPAPPPPPIAIPHESSPPLSETLTPPSPSLVQEAATNNTWNDSEKAGVIIASIGGLLQVFVVAYLLVKRHQMLAMIFLAPDRFVSSCKKLREPMDLVHIIQKGRWACQQGQFTQSSGSCLGYYTILYLIQSLQSYSGFKYTSTRKILVCSQSRPQVK